MTEREVMGERVRSSKAREIEEKMERRWEVVEGGRLMAEGARVHD